MCGYRLEDQGRMLEAQYEGFHRKEMRVGWTRVVAIDIKKVGVYHIDFGSKQKEAMELGLWESDQDGFQFLAAYWEEEGMGEEWFGS